MNAAPDIRDVIEWENVLLLAKERSQVMLHRLAAYSQGLPRAFRSIPGHRRTMCLRLEQVPLACAIMGACYGVMLKGSKHLATTSMGRLPDNPILPVNPY